MKPPLSPSRARNAALINQCATPGLGSLLARRYVAGTGQLLLALTGFCMIIAWFWFLGVYHVALWEGEPTEPIRHWLGWGGILVFAVAWCWALITSLSLLRLAKRGAQAPSEARAEHSAPPLLP